MVALPDLIHAPLHCDVAPQYRGAVAVIGNMDGVHLGHRVLIEKTADFAAEAGANAAAIVFEPHPRRVFQQNLAPFQLTDLHTKRELLGEYGIQTLFVLPFIEDLYSQTPERFISETLGQRLGVKGIVTGTDFRFGAGRSGDAAALAKFAAASGILAHGVTPVLSSPEEKYSSSAVRNALIAGDTADAERMLGRPWSIRGPVIEGRRLARTLNFPTANIRLGDYLRPLFGVYVVDVELNGKRVAGVANIGVRPTVDGTQEMLEVHLLDTDADLYNRTLEVRFRAFLRSEKKFDGLPALQAQIAADVADARDWFDNDSAH